MKEWKVNDEYASALNSELMHDEREHKQIQTVLTNFRQNTKRNKDKKNKKKCIFFDKF